MSLKADSKFDVVLGIRPDSQWVQLLQTVARAYLEAHFFPQKLIEHCLSAIGEAAEQMVSLQITRGLCRPFEIGLVWEDEAVSIHFIYDASIPLNPHKEPQYECLAPRVGTPQFPSTACGCTSSNVRWIGSFSVSMASVPHW